MSGKTVKGSLVGRLVSFGVSPLKILISTLPGGDPVNYSYGAQRPHEVTTGVIDSLNYLLHHVNFNKPDSTEHLIAKLLVKAF